MQPSDTPTSKIPRLDPSQMVDLDPPNVVYLKKLALATQASWEKGESTDGTYGVAKKDLINRSNELRDYVYKINRLTDRIYEQRGRLEELGRKIVIDAINQDAEIMDSRIREGDTITVSLALLYTTMQLYLSNE